MNPVRLREQLVVAQTEFDLNSSRLVELTLTEPEKRDSEYQRNFRLASRSANNARLDEQNLLYGLYPETRPDAVDRELERAIEATDDEIARWDEFSARVPACAGPDGSFPAVTGSQLLMVSPNPDGLHAKRARLFFAREAHNRARLDRFFEVRKLERNRTSLTTV